jgi:ElaB/YqjD/DUF883 family membrane-anchored ribosome-binding protein
MSADHRNDGNIASLAKRLIEELQRAKDNIGRSAAAAGADLATELRQLQDDLAAIQHTISALADTARAETCEASARMRGAGAEAASQFAADASNRVHSTIADFENFARRNPRCVLACALGLGAVLGLLMRRR